MPLIANGLLGNDAEWDYFRRGALSSERDILDLYMSFLHTIVLRQSNLSGWYRKDDWYYWRKKTSYRWVIIALSWTILQTKVGIVLQL